MIRLTGARQALIQAYRFGWASPETSVMELQTTIQTTKKSNCNKQVDGTLLGAVLGEVERQPIVIKGWINLAYGVLNKDDHAHKVFQFNMDSWLHTSFWDWHEEMEVAGLAKKATERRIDKINLMMPLAIQDSMFRVKTAQQKYKPHEIQLGIRADHSAIAHWARDWKPYYNQLINLCDELDKKSLAPIAKLIKIINKVDDDE